VPDPAGPAATAGDTAGDYVLGTHAEELERLRVQHALWRPIVEAALDRAGLTAGAQVLDLGAGPGFVAQDLARRVGPQGRVLALEHSPVYVAAGQALAAQAGLPQLTVQQHDLLRDPLPSGRFDLAWMRWVAMFLGDLEPLLSQLPRALRPGGQLLLHEYMHWDTFGLHPHGRAIARFGQAVQRSFKAAGGDPDVNRRLPSLLAAQGWRLEALTPLPVLGGDGSMAARWLQRFVAVYAPQLIAQGLWSAHDQAEADAEIQAARTDPGSYWVGPTVLELRATR
jgi:SAM-dependent methyltransferase